MLDRILVGVKIGRKAALVADRRGLAFLLEEGLERVEHLGRPAERLAERGRACGHDHEFLRVHGVRRMCAAVEDVHHRHGQDIRLKSAEEAIERNALGLRRRIGCRDGDREDCIRAEVRFIFRAVHVEHRLIHGVDVRRLKSLKGGADLFVDVLDGFGNALAAVFRLVAVAQFERFELARGRTGGRCAASDRTVEENDFRLDRRIAARINDLTSDDLSDS